MAHYPFVMNADQAKRLLRHIEGKALKPALDAAANNPHWRNVYADGFVGRPHNSRIIADAAAGLACDEPALYRLKVTPK